MSKANRTCPNPTKPNLTMPTITLPSIAYSKIIILLINSVIELMIGQHVTRYSGLGAHAPEMTRSVKIRGVKCINLL